MPCKRKAKGTAGSQPMILSHQFDSAKCSRIANQRQGSIHRRPWRKTGTSSVAQWTGPVLLHLLKQNRHRTRTPCKSVACSLPLCPHSGVSGRLPPCSTPGTSAWTAASQEGTLPSPPWKPLLPRRGILLAGLLLWIHENSGQKTQTKTHYLLTGFSVGYNPVTTERWL